MLWRALLGLVVAVPAYSANHGDCGPNSWQNYFVPDSHFVDFSPACQQHDVCYSTCGKVRKACDLSFWRTMRRKCQTAFNSFWHKIQRRGCLETANTYYSVVHRMGRDFFHAAQAECQKKSSKVTIAPAGTILIDLGA